MNYFRASRGFTLVESLIYFGILSILLVAVAGVSLQVIYGKLKAETIQEVSQNARSISERLSDRIRNAQSISSPSVGQTAASLTLVMADSSKNPTIFNSVANILQIKEGVGATSAISADEVKIDSVSFSNISYPNTPGTIRIALTLSSANTSLFKEYKYQETFYTTVTIRPR